MVIHDAANSFEVNEHVCINSDDQEFIKELMLNMTDSHHTNQGQ